MKNLVMYNLNNYVYVTLDKKGKQILRDYYSTDESMWLSKDYPNYYRLQFYDLMNIFGGSTCASYAPYSMCALIEKDSIEDIDA